MRKPFLPYIALGLVVLLGALHFIAETFYLYWTIWWFDNAMHLLAGFAGGFVVVWLLSGSYIFYKRLLSNFELVLLIVVSVLVVSVAWEVFEYLNDITQSAESYALDTSLDLLFDMLGVGLASLVGVRYVFSIRD